MTESEATPQTTSQPPSLVRRRWPTLVGLGFAALVAFDLVSGVELAPVLAASAAVYLGGGGPAATARGLAAVLLQALALLGFGAAAGAALVVNPELGAYLVAAGL
ncbi:MAG TPA: hypothetical protein VF468_13920, partial [Actinomycetota bacterium]|nr:hypothetical protein [Actinomycetota bacterium]